ncbi:MAG: DegV family protein, partial [Eubacteriales bacterium]
SAGERRRIPPDFPAVAQAFLELFEQAKKNGDEVVAILLSSALSGTYQSAVLAKQMVDYEGIYLIDSLTATGVIQILADYAQELIEKGKSAAEVAKQPTFSSQGTRYRHGRYTGVFAKGRSYQQNGGHDRRTGKAQAPDYAGRKGRRGRYRKSHRKK